MVQNLGMMVNLCCGFIPKIYWRYACMFFENACKMTLIGEAGQVNIIGIHHDVSRSVGLDPTLVSIRVEADSFGGSGECDVSVGVHRHFSELIGGAGIESLGPKLVARR